MEVVSHSTLVGAMEDKNRLKCWSNHKCFSFFFDSAVSNSGNTQHGRIPPKRLKPMRHCPPCLELLRRWNDPLSLFPPQASTCAQQPSAHQDTNWPESNNMVVREKKMLRLHSGIHCCMVTSKNGVGSTWKKNTHRGHRDVTRETKRD